MSVTITTRLVLALAVAAVLSASTSARQAGPLLPEDYGRWENLAAQRTPLSPDGRWLVYGITRSSRQT